jgi:hypothetical protein
MTAFKTLENAFRGRPGRRDALLTCARLGIVVLVVVAALAAATSASAETTGPVWKILSVATPTNFKAGDSTGDDSFLVTATNVGGASTGCTAALIASEKLREEKEKAERHQPSHGICHPAYGGVPESPVVPPITISDSLPEGLTATEIFGTDAYKAPAIQVTDERLAVPGSYPGRFMSCSTSPVLDCTTAIVEPKPVDPGDTLVVTIAVDVASNFSPGVPNVVTVSGGGAASVSASDPVSIGSALPEYGVAPGGLMAATSTDRAGAHPNVTTAFFLNTINPSGVPFEAEPVGTPKDVRFDLPPGLVGTTVGMARCAMVDVINESHCPADTMVGAATFISVAPGVGRLMTTVPVFNIAPAPGEPAAFGFNALLFAARLDTSVLSNGDYGVRVTAPDITEGAATYASSVTIWGVPADHNGPGLDRAARNLAAGEVEGELAPTNEIAFGGPGVEQTRVPLLTNPSQCSTPLEATLSTDSWEALGPGVFASASTSMGTDTGCDQLSFKPTVSMLPDTLEAGAPAGYTFDLNVPQNTEPEGLGTPNVKKVVATLPLGTVISPSAADGLGDCTNEQFGLHSGVPGSCPRDSQVGTVRIKTPALEERLNGEVYLASPLCDPCSPGDAQDGRMIRLFVQVVGEGEDGVIVKLEGTGVVNQQTGQLTTTFENNPQLPFSEFQLTLQGGERATLANPRTCGAATTTLDLTPWSSPFTPDVTPTSTFDVKENCFGPRFNPSFTAGTTSNQAGAFSPFTLSFGRSDSDEFLNGVQVKMPPGLSGMLSKVSLCGEPQASQGTCGEGSLIGETTVETGPGADPFLVTGGKVYITGPYKGAPYGLSIVVPAKAGPYTLSGTTGNGTVVNRSAISVNPETAALTVTSDPLPTELDGIPLQLRLVNVTINRPGFTFNPTSCNPLAIGGTLTSTKAASASVSSSFQVTNCAALKFEPKFQVSTSGKSSKAKGASLTVKLSYPAGSQGTQANIARVKVELPKQLPSQLKTLQKACLAAVFEANPAGCPAESIVGHATVHTPLLPVPLEGPAYFVSHGGEEFPDLTLVLQGYGVTVQLVGSTFISKAGITSSTFKATPDVPFNAFELTLPQGKYAALTTYNHATAGGSLCGQSLTMPTEFRAQNGAEIHQSTPITVTGCPAAITVVRQGVKGKTATIQVRVPGAGKLVATAKGLSKASKTAKGATTLTLELTLTNAEAVFLGKHKTRKLKAKVNLQFTPKKGGKLKTSTTVIVG